MIKSIVSVADLKAQVYMQPAFVRTVGEAIRGIQNEVQANPDSLLAKYPQDFSLYHIGDFNEDTGVIKAFDAPISVGLVSSLIVKE